MISSFYAGETIKALFEQFKEYPWVPFVVLLTVIGSLWYIMEHVTKRK
jgi:hypothetical protein